MPKQDIRPLKLFFSFPAESLDFRRIEPGSSLSADPLKKFHSVQSDENEMESEEFQGVGGFLIVNDRKNPALAYQTQDNTVETGSDHILTFFKFLQDGGKVFVI